MLARLKALSQRVQAVALDLFRVWWRPLTCVTGFATLAVNGIYLPLHLHAAADLTGLAAVLAALTPFAVARSFDKWNEGKSDNG